MRRVFWLALGATVGVLVVRRVGRLADRWTTPEGLAGVAGEVGDRFAGFWADVREGMTEREAELRHALGIEHTDEGG